MCVCVFRIMEESRLAKGELERSLYHMERKKKPVHTTRVSHSHTPAHSIDFTLQLSSFHLFAVLICLFSIQTEPVAASVRSLRRPQRKQQQKRHAYHTRSARERRRTHTLTNTHEDSISESDSEAEVQHSCELKFWFIFTFYSLQIFDETPCDVIPYFIYYFITE